MAGADPLEGRLDAQGKSAHRSRDLCGTEGGTKSWYAPGGEFCELDKRLELAASPACCWAHLAECGEDQRKLDKRAMAWFSWSGNNSWLDRTAAARSLGQELLHLLTWADAAISSRTATAAIALEFLALTVATSRWPSARAAGDAAPRGMAQGRHL
jgi:hypothetical protein